MPAPSRQPLIPAPISLFLCKSFAIVLYTFSTLSFPSAGRITVLLLDKNIHRRPANKNPAGISANKGSEFRIKATARYFAVPEL